MADVEHFCKQLAQAGLREIDNAIGLLWFYRQTQLFDDRTPSELADDLHEQGFPKPNISRLRAGLAKSNLTARGRRKKSFQINVRHMDELDSKFAKFVRVRTPAVTDSIIPSDWVKGTRRYLEKLVLQMNGCNDSGFYDAASVMCRRLMESLIIEVYIHQSRKNEIQDAAGNFLGLERLIAKVCNDSKVTLGRNAAKTMQAIKELGDTAAHDRTYIVVQEDLSAQVTQYRILVAALLRASDINP